MGLLWNILNDGDIIYYRACVCCLKDKYST